ncbi:MAG: S-layer homology domain-containing protein [Clostridiales bacterium]|nr:S-layer homology domain-containing protein [Clostridiales bacterium]
MKRLLTILLSLGMVLSITPSVFAASDEATSAANALYELGLFRGTGTDASGNPIFELDRAPTRHEAITMLVRLLGKESEAKAGSWAIPFTDVADWAKPYVGYAYANGLTSGTSATTYGGNDIITASQYITFVLRALGYSSGTDFQWDKAWELSDRIGLTDGRYNAGTFNFTRGDVAIVSHRALSADHKREDQTLPNPSGDITVDKLQGVWQSIRQEDNYNHSESEYVFSGNQFTYAYSNTKDNNTYILWYRMGTYQIQGDKLILLLSYQKDYNALDNCVSSITNSRTDELAITDFLENSIKISMTSYNRVSDSTIKDQVTNALAEKESNPSTSKPSTDSSTNDYTYLAASDFRSIRRQYSNAAPRCAYVVAFTDKNGDKCVLVDLYWKIINNYHDVILHNLTTGRVINDPATYYGNMANRQYGASKLHYMDLQLEVLEHLAGETKSGTYISPEALSQ